MNQKLLFLDYLWDSIPNYFDLKLHDSGEVFNRPQIPTVLVDEFFLDNLQQGLIFINKPIERDFLYIGLTPKGGEVWEQYYQVNWSHYVDYETKFLDQERCRFYICSQNRELLFSVFPSLTPFLEKNLSLCDDFEVTYWKKLDRVFSSFVEFSVEDEDEFMSGVRPVSLPVWRKSY